MASEESMKMNIHSVTGEWNKTVYDPYVNMLRTQTEAMSATLGGADSLTVLPFDSVFAGANEFSERIARNQQLLLREESHFDKTADPAAGSYYIENLTASMAGEAWKLFLEIERRRLLEALYRGSVQERVAATRNKRRSDVAREREASGTNIFPNQNEVVKDKPTGKSRNVPVGDQEVNLLRLAGQLKTLRR
ncbi:MAG: methylmalonyl-CoA mutase family protein [Bacteroidales bacterium]